MNFNLAGVSSRVTGGEGAITSGKIASEKGKFSALIEKMTRESEAKIKNHSPTISTSEITKRGSLNGDVKSDFSLAFTSPLDRNALPKGAALNGTGLRGEKRTIDKTSELYEKSMELESYFVKQMLSSMRKTVNKSGLIKEDFASEMYSDMLYDEYAMKLTANAGLGLADQIYLSLC